MQQQNFGITSVALRHKPNNRYAGERVKSGLVAHFSPQTGAPIRIPTLFLPY